MNNNELRKILDRKILGQDCTEQESAEVKGYFRDNWDADVTPLFSSMMQNFPLEYGEIEDEKE